MEVNDLQYCNDALQKKYREEIAFSKINSSHQKMQLVTYNRSWIKY